MINQMNLDHLISPFGVHSIAHHINIYIACFIGAQILHTQQIHLLIAYCFSCGTIQIYTKTSQKIQPKKSQWREVRISQERTVPKENYTVLECVQTFLVDNIDLKSSLLS